MITLADTDARKLALESEEILYAPIIDLQFSTAAGGPRYITDFNRDLVVGGRTYSHQADLIGITPPRVQGLVGEGAESQLAFLDPDGTWKERFTTAGYSGIRMTMQVVFVSGTTGTVSAPLDIYRGRCTSVDVAPSEDQGLALRASFVGPLSKLDSDASVLASDSQQRGRSKDDDAFAYIHVARNIPWGRKIKPRDGSGSQGAGQRPTR